MTTVTFPADGATHTWVVPANVFSLQLLADGAGAYNARGARVRAVVPVTPGQTIIYQSGRRNGGDQPYGRGAAACGGATVVWRDSISNTNLLVVAGGAAPNASSGRDGSRGPDGASVAWTSSTYTGDPSLPFIYGSGVLLGGTGGVGGVGGSQAVNTGSGGGGSGAGGPGSPGDSITVHKDYTDGAGNVQLNVQTYRSGAGGPGAAGSYLASAVPAGNITGGSISTADANDVDGAISVTYSASPPTAPLIIAPDSGSDVDIDLGVTVIIASTLPTANPLTSADLRWKAAGDTDWTEIIGAYPDAASTSYTFPAGVPTAGVQVEIQARCTDSYGTTTAYGASTFVTPRHRPDPAQFATPEPDGTVTSATAMATLVYVPAAAVQARRLGDANGFPDEGLVLDPAAAVTVTGTDPWVFTGDPAVHPLGVEHLQVRYQTTASGTLWSDWSDLRVQMNLNPPPKPIARLVPLPADAAVQVGWSIPVQVEGESAAATVAVFRTQEGVNGGARVRVARDLPPDAGPVIDREARPAVPAFYTVVAYAANGAATESE